MRYKKISRVHIKLLGKGGWYKFSGFYLELEYIKKEVVIWDKS